MYLNLFNVYLSQSVHLSIYLSIYLSQPFQYLSIYLSIDLSVVYWPSTPPNMPFQSDAPTGSDTFRWQLWEEIALAGLVEKMGQGKIPWYTHRPMHRKRVTCELHDSYFRLMTIKHAILKIEWTIELLHNSVNAGSQWVGDQMGWRQDVVEKATTQQKRPSGPLVNLETRLVGEKMLEWEHVPDRLGPQVPGWAAQENETDTWQCPEGLRRSICCSLCSVSNSLSHTTFQIKWEIYFFKRSLRSFFIIASICILHVYVLCVRIVNHGHGETTYLSQPFQYLSIYLVYIYVYTVRVGDIEMPV